MNRTLGLALLVDDEPLARGELRALLEELATFEAIDECGNAIEAIQALRSRKPDALFLDVQMPAVNGFELLGMLDPEDTPPVVFVTAYDAFAVQAFERNAADYLLKPVTRDRLRKAVEKLARGIPAAGQAPAVEPGALAAPLARVPCLAGRAIKLVPLSEIDAVRSGEAGVYVQSAQGEFFTELTLKVLEERAGLFRCHKQHLVNVERVDEIQPGEDEGALLRTRGGHEVPVSRRFLPALRVALGLTPGR